MHKSFLSFVLAGAAAFGQQAASPTYNAVPSREIGQPALVTPLVSSAPNLVEGRELNTPVAIAFDTSATPPILYVADTVNNRVLAWKNSTGLLPCGINSYASGCGAADMVIGQRDKTSTLQGGPASPVLSTGLSFPSAVAVDANGNLYVADAGNNRVLRFPAPFKQTSALLTVDLVIGQKTVSSGNQANQGMQTPTAQTLSFAPGGSALRAGLAIEPSGGADPGALWVTDPGNNRALRFPVSQLAPNTILPSADIALGQQTLTTGTIAPTPPGTQTVLYKSSLNQPSGIVFDQKGRLYIADNYARVLFYSPPFVSFLTAMRILGIAEQLQGQPTLLPTNNYGLLPAGVFTNGTNLFVADAGNNRIAEYDVPENWPAPPNANQSPQTAQDSPPILAVIGQPNVNSAKANQGNPEASASTVSTPLGGAFPVGSTSNGTDMWIADTGNNRVLKFSIQSGSYSTATGLVGQVDFPYSQPNLIEGREVYLTNGFAGGDVAVDTSANATAPHLYVADTYNNRILGFKDVRSVQPGQVADIVIGQSDESTPGSRFYRALVNNPANDPEIPSNTGLNAPTGVIVDAAGNLWVADTGNGRVLRYPAPFSQSAGAVQLPNVVLGQQSFNSLQNFNASQQTMHSPYGLGLFSNGSLAVSDPAQNRILIFKPPAGGDFSNGQNAAIVLGQTDFGSTGTSSANGGLNSPRHLAVDTSDRLYVADSNNNRMLVFVNPLGSQNGTASAFQLPAQTPQGVAINALTGEIWLTLGSNAVWLLPEFEKLELNTNPNSPFEQQLNLQTTPLSIALDASFNPIIAEGANRVSFYFPELVWQHAANYNSQPLSPGQLALLYRVGQPFVLTTASATTNPWPTTLSDLQVTVNGTLAPIFRVDPSDIAFQVPSNAPSTGTASFLVTRVSTGEIVAAASIPMQQFSPGFFALNAQGTGQIAAINTVDNSVNSQTNPVSRDGSHYIQFYLTGGGVFTGGPGAAPQDGYAPTAVAATSVAPELIMANGFGANGIVPASDITYSGAGGFPGGWVINFLVPTSVPPGLQVVVVSLGGVASNVGPFGQVQMTFYTQ